MGYLHIIRHGESVANVQQDIYKEIPDHAIPLSEKGILQAEHTGEELNNILKGASDIKIWSSPFKRAIDTASCIVDKLDTPIPIHKETFLAEINFGIFDGVKKSEREKAFPEEYARYKLTRQEKGKYWAKFPHGESSFDVDIRLIPVIQELKEFLQKDDNAHAVVVSHGTTSRVLIRRLLDISYQNFNDLEKQKNAQIHTLRLKDNVWECI